jgi:hypothetical protein
MPSYTEQVPPVLLLAELYAHGIEVRAIEVEAIGDGALGYFGPIEKTSKDFQLSLWYNRSALTEYVTNMEREVRA